MCRSISKVLSWACTQFLSKILLTLTVYLAMKSRDWNHTYDPVRKSIIKVECFNVIKNKLDGNIQGMIDVKEKVGQILFKCTSIVAFHGIKFDMPLILKWLEQLEPKLDRRSKWAGLQILRFLCDFQKNCKLLHQSE